jgi:superfamily II DNA or RNA helicase
MSQNHYIYLLFDNINTNRYLSYEVHKLGRKIGSTCNMKTRMKPYLTGHPDKVPLECYYKILNPELYTCYEIDNMIKIKFDEYNLKGSGGIEFYEADKVTQKVLEEYFEEMEIKWEKLNDVIDEDIHNITKEDIQNLTYDIEHIRVNRVKIVQEKTYNLLNNYINQIKVRDIIKELLKIDTNLFAYLLDNYDDSLIINLKKQNKNIINDQIETILCTILYFNKYDKGIWNLFCRYGKTMLSSLFCNMERKYKKILILVPSLYLIGQTHETWVKYCSDKIIKKVCCEENISNEQDIYDFYKSNEYCIFISTYHSSEKFINYEFDICIYDEAHRTAGNKYDTVLTTPNSDSEEQVQHIKVFKLLLESKHIKQKIFLTATKKIYHGDEDNIYCMDDENIYGKTIVSVSAIKAKELGRICPYKIMTIKTTPIEITFDIDSFFKENKLTEEKIKKLKNLKDRYIMFAKGLIDCIKTNNIKHVITFHEYIINCKFFCEILNNINKTEYILTNVKYITGNNKKKERLKIIEDFETKDYSILCSAKVLQEGVDIPRCDGVIFIDNKTSNIDITQSLSRCLTALKEENKEAYIMIPYVDGDDLKNDEKTNDLRLLLRNIKEIDENVQEYFKKYNEIDSDDKTSKKREEELKLLNIKYNINIELNFIEEMKEISYILYKQAKELIKGKYNDRNDYKNNIEEFSKELPINADQIYKRFGWRNWNEYLGLENTMNMYRISKIIQNENEKRTKLLNGKLTGNQSIKYILKINSKEMFAKDICTQILDYHICGSLNGLTPELTINANCGNLYRDKIIKRTIDKPYKYSYDGYNEFEIIDSKEKYIEYCKNVYTELEQNIEPENGNWIKFCLKDYDELVKSHYKSDELKDIFKKLEISNKNQYIEKSKTNKKLINYEYISNGFYNESNLGINLDKLYFIKKQNIRR